MTLLICSKSTRKYFPGIENIHVVTEAPKKNVLSLADSQDDVIAVGGGAVIDTAKIISKSPITCYPTTASGSSATSWAVYWEGEKKHSYKSMKPERVYFDESFLEGLPQEVIEYTTYDLVSHCLDSLWSIYSTKESKEYVYQALEKIKNAKSNIDIVKAGHIAGEAIEITATSILHCLSYPLTAFYGIPHGKALGYLLPRISQWMGDDVYEILGHFEVELNFPIDAEKIIDEALSYQKISSINRKISREVLIKVMCQDE